MTITKAQDMAVRAHPQRPTPLSDSSAEMRRKRIVIRNPGPINFAKSSIWLWVKMIGGLNVGNSKKGKRLLEEKITIFGSHVGSKDQSTLLFILYGLQLWIDSIKTAWLSVYCLFVQVPSSLLQHSLKRKNLGRNDMYTVHPGSTFEAIAFMVTNMIAKNYVFNEPA